MTLGTFHSFCARILRWEVKRLGYLPNFSITDESDMRGLVRQAEAELGYRKEDMAVF